MNNYEERIPKEMTILADYGGEYAWNEKGAAISIADYFEGKDFYCLLEELERELAHWQLLFERETLGNRENFPWDEFHENGLKLARKLAEILSGTDIKVSYRPPFEDPDRSGSPEIIIQN